jgi:hypothetical protein
LDIQKDVILYEGRRYLVTIGVQESLPENMTLSLASFAVSHQRVQFFTTLQPIVISENAGFITPADDSNLFNKLKIIQPIPVIGLVVLDKKGNRIEDLSQLCVLEDADGDYFLEDSVKSALADGISSLGLKWKDVTFQAFFPKWYFARSVKQLTRAEMKIINSMSLNVISRLKEKDPEAVEEIMRLMNLDSEAVGNESSSKTDNYLNMQISVNHPDLGEELREAQIKQMIKRLSFMLKMSVEMLQDIYDSIPNGVDIIDTIDRELRGIVDEDDDDDKKKVASKVDVIGTAEILDEEPEPEEQIKVILPAGYIDAIAVEEVEDDSEEEEPNDPEDPEEELKSLEEYAKEFDEAIGNSDSSEDEEEDDEEEPEEIKPARKVRRVKKVKPAEDEDED